ncbi:DNA alkylation repair protein [Streptococcus panodentis]|uniref:DNA alkylation repair protein n=1 Tax=Streptococcus panodentis TaxID=1581472 RepID=A0ABS5AWU1_9STRE|nr:DNA alkylation repair protein [Streptococcus panodentis]MBP2621042.1 DNA alkylation repair protein [Streptococcus panodentis]
MELNQLTAQLQAVANPDDAKAMKAYMKNQFEFLGVKTPVRRKIAKAFFKSQTGPDLDWDFVRQAWKVPYRELQYAALDYLDSKKKLLQPEDLPRLKRLAQSKSWWDTIDFLDRLVGSVIYRFPETQKIILDWSQDENFWLRRLAIDHQLLRKEETNTELLEQILLNNLGQTEFFINKAIGWALRDYSKTNPDWVRDFIQKHGKEMAALSIREGSKYL